MAKVTAVQVAYRDLTQSVPTGSSGGYSYSWGLAEEPRIGHWVVVDADGDLTTAVVVALGRGESAKGMRLKSVQRFVYQEEIDKAYAEWFDGLRMAVELPALTVSPNPSGVPESKGDPSDPTEAKRLGKAWWSIHKKALAQGRPQDEVAAYKQVANRWFSASRESRGYDATLTTRANPAAGWYPNQQGQQQWWDGERWGQLAPPPSVQVSQAPVIVNQRKMRKTSHGLHLFLSIVTLGLWLPVWLIMGIYNSARS